MRADAETCAPEVSTYVAMQEESTSGAPQEAGEVEMEEAGGRGGAVGQGGAASTSEKPAGCVSVHLGGRVVQLGGGVEESRGAEAGGVPSISGSGEGGVPNRVVGSGLPGRGARRLVCALLSQVRKCGGCGCGFGHGRGRGRGRGRGCRYGGVGMGVGKGGRRRCARARVNVEGDGACTVVYVI